MAGELSLVSEKNLPDGGAMTSSITLSSDEAYRWYSWVHEDALASIVVIKCRGKC